MRSRDLKILFESVHGHPVARLPRDATGNVRRGDGRKYLNVLQAARAFGMTRRQLVDLYASTFADLLPAPMRRAA